MILLAVDTSSGEGSPALGREDGWRDVAPLPAEWKSTTLHGELERLLARNGLQSRDLDGYAVASGPGPFTGLRIGLTAVKALAEVHDKPIVPISTLEVLAAAARAELPADFSGELAPLRDARRGQIFGALYHVERETMRRLIGESVGSIGAFLDRIKGTDSKDVRFCGTEIALFASQIAQAGWDDTSLIALRPGLAATLARMGLEQLRAGKGIAAAAAEANYIRPADAELFWKGS